MVDVPIGLCGSLELEETNCVVMDGELSRKCDDLARKILGPRSSSVFTPPCREAVRMAAAEEEYSEINRVNREETGKGLSVQAHNIAPVIKEVDDFLRDHGDPEVVLEGHPEVCFRAFADEELRHSKRSARGVGERLDALENCSDYTQNWRDLSSDITGPAAVGLDDLLDAIALALTARAPGDELQKLPNDDQTPTDEKGLPMQMVYRREQPFEAN